MNIQFLAKGYELLLQQVFPVIVESDYGSVE